MTRYRVTLAFTALGLLAVAQEAWADPSHSTKRSEIIQSVIASSARSNCPLLTQAQAKSVAHAAVQRKADTVGFNIAYEASCDFKEALIVAKNHEAAFAFSAAIKSSGRGLCPTLTPQAARKAALKHSDRKIRIEDFNSTYLLSCDFEVSLKAAITPQVADSYLEVIRSSSSGRCLKLKPDEALKVALGVHHKQLRLNAFTSAYDASCSYVDAWAVAQSQKMGSWKAGAPLSTDDRRRENQSQWKELATETYNKPSEGSSSGSAAH